MNDGGLQEVAGTWRGRRLRHGPMLSSRDKLWRATLSLVSLGQPTAKAGYMESPAPRGEAEGTEQRVLALHTKEAREGD